MSNLANIARKHFSHRVNPHMWNKVVPKCFPYLEDSVDSDTINFVVRYEPLDPSDEHIENN